MRHLRFLSALCTILAVVGCHDTTEAPAPPASRTIHVQDWNYVQGKYFFLIDPNDPNAPTGPITKVHLYLDDKDPRNNVELGALEANVWLDPRTQTGPSTRGWFHLLTEQDYTLPNDLNFGFPRIDLTNQLSQYQTLAVAYIQTVGAVSETVGTWIDTNHPLGPDSTLVLKMLRPPDDQWGNVDLRTSPWGEVRFLEAKNVYSLGIRDIEPGSLTLDVMWDIYGTAGQNPDYMDNEFHKRTLLLQVLGLDQKNNTDPSNRIPDQRIDPEFVDLADGLIVFPDLRPFDPDLADIEGTSVRSRSWPRQDGVQRPDTLGWYKDQYSGQPVPSRADVRNREVVPEIYDLRFTELSHTSLQHHLYTIEAKITVNPFIPD